MKEIYEIEAVDLEKKFLACILAHPRLMKKAAFLVRPEYFYRDAHRDIYEAMMSLYQHDRHCNLDAVTYELERNGRLSESVYHFQETWKFYIDSPLILGDVLEIGTILKRKAKMRRLKDIGYEIEHLAISEVEDAVEQAEQKVCSLMMDEDERANSTLADEIDFYMDELAQRRKNAREGITPGLSTGFYCLDPIFKLLPGELATIAALTGFGKSALALGIALHLILQSKRVMLFSLEMSRQELVQRILSIDTEIDQSLLSSGRIDDDEHERVKFSARRLRACDMMLNDCTYGVDEIVNKAKFEHAVKPVDLIIVDYVQLIESISKGKGGENRAQEVERVSRRLKQLAQKLNVPVLILSQVNREVEKRSLQEPQLSDLSDSSGVAKNSNRVAFIYMTQEEAVRRQASQAFRIRFKVAKNRSGPIGEEGLVFAPRITRFKDELLDELLPEPEEVVNGYV
jgi:replicative DNA helicase